MKKNHSTLWKVWLKVAACAFFALAMACSDGGGENDIPEPTPPAPTPDNTTGSIDFNLKGEDGSNLSSQEPLNVGSEEGLELVISQKSSYTDPNGQVYTCEPKASIVLEVKCDTIYAKDLQSLTAISGTPSKQTEASGTNPVKKQTLQSFSIGGQDVLFDLSHEIYTYTNSQQKKIEMPYIQVGEAKFGKGEAAESKSASSPVTLRSLAMSRASLTDSTLFEVNAKFNLELATVNTKESQKQTLNFDVKYLAVVENVTELTGVLEYDLDQKEYNLKGGEETTVVLKQDSKFANGDVAVYTGQPQASVSLKAEKEQVFVGSVDELKSLIDTEDAKTSQEGSNPITHTYQKKYATKNQSFEFATSYQVCFTNETGEEMPYLKVNEPELIGIEATAKGSRASVSDTTYYDVKATFSVELEGVNVGKEHKQTLTFTVDYEGAVVETIPLTPSLTYTLKQTEYSLNGGDEKEIIITQASQYKNGDQAVFSYEPKAMIKFIVGQETVYVDNVEALKKAVAGKAQAGKTGSQPLKHTYSTTWNAGGQTFTFENSYEVYTSEDGDEMPYLKVNEPELIGIEATAKGSRASLNDTTYYDVKATFSVELEGVNVSEEDKRTLTFTVDYEGAVVEATPLTPVLEYTFVENEEYVQRGNQEGNKFMLYQTGLTRIGPTIQVKSAFMNGDSVVQQIESQISFTFDKERNDLRAESMEQLKTLIETEDATILLGSYKKTFSTYGMDFYFFSYTRQPEDMPYLKVGAPKLVSIETVEPESRVVISGIVSSHQMKATFEVELTPMNIDLPSEKLTIELYYEGSIKHPDKEIGELVSTNYRKDMIYKPPKGNLIARAQAVVYRDRQYEDGTVLTDSIYGGNWFMLENSADVHYIFSNDSVKTGVIERDYNEAGIYITTGNVEVPDLEKLNTEISLWHMNSEVPGDYSTYSEEFEPTNYYNPSNPVEGWYVYKVGCGRSLIISYSHIWYCELRLDVGWYDRFLYIDGRIIDFAEYRPKWDDGTFTTQDISGGRIYTLESKGTYVGQEVHMKSEVTVREKK